MGYLRLSLLSVACIWLSAGSLFAQSPGEEIGPLPFQLGPGHWALLEMLKPQLTEVLILPQGTPVSLEFLTFLTTRTAKHNERVEFRVVSDVSVQGLTVIPKDSVAWLSREDPQTQAAVGSILKDVFAKGHHAELLPATPAEPNSMMQYRGRCFSFGTEYGGARCRPVADP
jgi:hypothetical protein